MNAVYQLQNPYLSIDPRSLLEVADVKHRYGKNLRVYFREFNSQFPNFLGSDCSLEAFFDWLDNPVRRPNDLSDCSLALLDNDTVQYLSSDEERSQFKYIINEEGLMQHSLSHNLLTTQSKGDMFVLRDSVFYISEKKTKSRPRFHHSSFFGGEAVNSAGIMICEEGRIKVIYPHSGHYRPVEENMLWLLDFLQSQTINLSTLLVDAQRIFKISRHSEKENGPKAKKMDCLYLQPGNVIQDFLRMKYAAKSQGIFVDILQRSSSVALAAATNIRMAMTSAEASQSKMIEEHSSEVAEKVIRFHGSSDAVTMPPSLVLPIFVSNSFTSANGATSLSLLAASPVID